MTRVSVIVPTLNRPNQLALCLQALAHQDFGPQQFEVVVVDDGGEVDLDAVATAHRENLRLRIVTQSNTGPAGARNAGVAQATGEFLAFTDDDCAPEPGWLTALTRRLEQAPSRLHGGHTVNALEHNVYSSASQALIDYLYAYYNAVPEQARFFASNNMAVSRRMFESVGGFDARFPRASGEDRDLCDRWLQLGHQMSYVAEARVRHMHELGLGSFWRQHFTYGIGASRFWACRNARGQDGPLIEPLSFYLDLVRHAFANDLRQPLSLTLLLVLSQLANAAGFAVGRFGRAGRMAAPAAPPANR